MAAFGTAECVAMRALQGQLGPPEERGEPGMIYRFTVGQGAATELSGSLTGGTPGATVTSLAAGAACGE